MSSHVVNDTRLEMRIPTSIKRTIEKAARLTGKTISSYAISELQVSAERDIREYESISLNNRERDRFMKIFSNTLKPNDSLKKLMSG